MATRSSAKVWLIGMPEKDMQDAGTDDEPPGRDKPDIDDVFPLVTDLGHRRQRHRRLATLEDGQPGEVADAVAIALVSPHPDIDRNPRSSRVAS